MQPVLVDLLGLALNGKQLHWHVQGRLFLPIHQRLDKVIKDARGFADEVAERLVALGVPGDGRPPTDSSALGRSPPGAHHRSAVQLVWGQTGVRLRPAHSRATATCRAQPVRCAAHGQWL
nr:ferritin-like domain-containing protein [Actinopolymorpha pittospori]